MTKYPRVEKGCMKSFYITNCTLYYITSFFSYSSPQQLSCFFLFKCSCFDVLSSKIAQKKCVTAIVRKHKLSGRQKFLPVLFIFSRLTLNILCSNNAMIFDVVLFDNILTKFLLHIQRNLTETKSVCLCMCMFRKCI